MARPVDSWDRSRDLFEVDGDGLVPLSFVADEDAAAQLEQLVLLLLAADSIGGAAGILDQTIGYMKTREQFGQLIGSFQALKHRVADLSADILVGSQLVEQASDSFDAPAAALWCRLAKASATETYARTAAAAVQLHGGIGFTWEHSCHLYLKRARLNEALCCGNFALRDAAASELARHLSAGVEPMEIAA